MAGGGRYEREEKDINTHTTTKYKCQDGQHLSQNYNSKCTTNKFTVYQGEKRTKFNLYGKSLYLRENKSIKMCLMSGARVC